MHDASEALHSLLDALHRVLADDGLRNAQVLVEGCAVGVQRLQHSAGGRPPRPEARGGGDQVDGLAESAVDLASSNSL